MGWWKINNVRQGQIDGSHVTGSRLLNAVPGRETRENYYNGDGPSDSLGDAVDQILAILGLTIPKPGSKDVIQGIAQQELLDLLLRRTVPAQFVQHASALLKAVDDLWADVDEQYQEDWERNPYPEEREAICNFVLNPLFS
jgi:hypothetical protein